ncbi:hypothetical protein [Salisediminibacterium beveridgei]|nr:hypothetical protein [Salisediminibacterium beveridgei]
MLATISVFAPPSSRVTLNDEDKQAEDPMGINHYYRRTGRAFFLLSIISGVSFVLFLLLYMVSDEGFTIDAMQGFLLLSVMTLGFLIAGFVKRHRAGQTYATPELIADEHDLHVVNRVVIAPVIHLLREYQVFALDGKRIAEVRDLARGWRRYAAYFLELIGIRMFFPKTLEVHNDKGAIYRLEKEAGIHEIYRLYSIEGTQLATYQMNVFNPFKTYALIYDASGNLIGENDGGISGQQFNIKDESDNTLIDMKYQGIPVEALELFSGINGDLVDLNHKRIPETLMPAFIIAPVIVKLHFRK